MRPQDKRRNTVSSTLTDGELELVDYLSREGESRSDTIRRMVRIMSDLRMAELSGAEICLYWPKESPPYLSNPHAHTRGKAVTWTPEWPDA